MKLRTDGLFIQSASGNANARMGPKPIDFAVVALPLTLCMNSLNYHCKTHRRCNANALCERTSRELRDGNVSSSTSDVQINSYNVPINLLIFIQDDMHVRVYNYNTLERVHQFEAHSDYLRAIAVHPTQPYILTSSGKASFACT